MSRYDILHGPLKVIAYILPVIGLILFIMYVFGWSIGGWVLENMRYYYLLYALFGAAAYLTIPIRKTPKHFARVPWYDILLAAVLFGICFYYSFLHESIQMGWIPPPRTLDIVLGTVLALLGLEAGRRIAGIPFLILNLLVGTYPLYAMHCPGFLWGFSLPFDRLIGSFAFSADGMLGMTAAVLGDIIIGFLLFAGLLIASGAGQFFLDLALGLMGRFRGGPAKVAVVSSGFFGSLSGLAFANVVTTGSITIPTMKRIGYPPRYAGAIEAVASTGGIIMPPVMGAVVFIMAILTDIPYAVIMVAAFIPAVLYYYGLLVQVDSYAAKAGLKGLSREEIPSLWKTLKEGWQYIAVLAFLVFGLLYMRWGATAPVYASGLIIVLSFTNRKTWLTPKRALESLRRVADLINFIVAVLLPVGLLLIGLSVTGTVTALIADIVTAGTNTFVILLVAAGVCYICGMVNVAFIPYIVLAVTVIPYIAGATGMSLIGLHLFVIYFLIMAGITPPVCVTAFLAAAIANGPPFKTGFTAMRLAVVLYFIPFFFVYNPALILDGPITETLKLTALCLVGIWILASGLEGYLIRVGILRMWSRALLVIGGFLIAFPGGFLALSDWLVSGIGAALTVAVAAVILMRKKAVEEKAIADSQ